MGKNDALYNEGRIEIGYDGADVYINMWNGSEDSDESLHVLGKSSILEELSKLSLDGVVTRLSEVNSDIMFDAGRLNISEWELGFAVLSAYLNDERESGILRYW